MNRGTDYGDDTSEPVDSAQQIVSHVTDDTANDVTSRKVVANKFVAEQILMIF